MEMAGEFRIPAPRETVWKALNDPEVLKRSIAGCEELEKLSDTEFVARVTAKIGPVKARFAGRVTLSDLDPPNGYRITGEGQGGAAGFAKGTAEVKLEPDGAATRLRYSVQAAVGGKLAQIGARLIDGAAHKMAEDFFGSFAQNVAGPPQAPLEGEVLPPAAPGEPVIPTPPPPRPSVGTGPSVGSGPSLRARSPMPPSQGVKPWLWVAVLVVIALVLLLIYGL